MLSAYGITTADILENIPDAFFALDREWRVLYLNPAAEQLIAVRRAELTDQILWEKLPGAVGTRFYDEYHRAMRDRVTAQFEEYYPPLGRWFRVRAHPTPQGLCVYAHDVTDRRASDDRYRQAAEQLGLALDHAGLGDWRWDAPQTSL